jgi:multisubunit Na+/H+ antiporter MnhB subunit
MSFNWDILEAFFLAFAPAATIWIGLYISAVSLRRNIRALREHKSFRIIASCLGFLVCFMIALLIRGLLDPTSQQPIGAAPFIQAVMLYYWLDPKREAKADHSFEWVMALVFGASVLSLWTLPIVTSTVPIAPVAAQEQAPWRPNQAEDAASYDGTDPSCRTEMNRGLAVVNCE